MEVDWPTIFAPYCEGVPRKKKFQILPKAIPWTGNFQENVDFTLEWLIREGKKDEVRLSAEPVTDVVRDDWYTLESEPGHFIHVCYPQVMLTFRCQYVSLRSQIMGDLVEAQTTTIMETADAARVLLWSAWNCLGHDGQRIEPVYDELSMDTYMEDVKYENWPQNWTYECGRCCSALPRSLQAWQKLQHTKLKGLS